MEITYNPSIEELIKDVSAINQGSQKLVLDHWRLIQELQVEALPILKWQWSGPSLEVRFKAALNEERSFRSRQRKLKLKKSSSPAKRLLDESNEELLEYELEE